MSTESQALSRQRSIGVTGFSASKNFVCTMFRSRRRRQLIASMDREEHSRDWRPLLDVEGIETLQQRTERREDRPGARRGRPVPERWGETLKSPASFDIYMEHDG